MDILLGGECCVDSLACFTQSGDCERTQPKANLLNLKLLKPFFTRNKNISKREREKNINRLLAWTGPH